jgi:hypothetical protein
MERHFKWEHAGKGAKRTFSETTQAHYVWNGSSVRVEVHKGYWKDIGEAAALDVADKLAMEYEFVLCPPLIEHHKERCAALTLASASMKRTILFKELFGPEGTSRDLYKAFCRLRDINIPCDTITARMVKMVPEDRDLLVKTMEEFYKEGRR